MKKSILQSLICVSALAVLLTAALSALGFYRLHEEQAQRQLQNQGRLILAGLDSAPRPLDYLDALSRTAPDLRLTLIDSGGGVVFDSSAPADGMENHETRQEVVQARREGFGECARRSDTLGETAYYSAYLRQDGSVLRLGATAQSLTAVFFGSLPWAAAIGLLMAGLALPISRWVTRRLMAPVMEAAQSLSLEEAPVGKPPYQEREPFLDKIRAQKAQIAASIHRIQQEKNTLSMITSGVREGLILIDGNKNVLSCNQAARELLQAPTGDLEGRSALELCPDPAFAQAVNQAMSSRQPQQTVLQVGPLYLRLYVSPAKSAPGGMILAVDSSQQVQAERQRRDFSANVSHELKTPLTSISGFAELIETGMARGQDAAQFAGRIRLEAGRLQFLIDDIMRLSEIEDGGKGEWEQVPLLQTARQAADTLALEAAEKEVSIFCQGEELKIEANGRMMEELTVNLLSNGVKYNRPGGFAWLTIERQGEMAAVIAEDTGIGIPLQHQDRVFERFYRVDKSRSKQTGGTGLGLSIVRHIVETHQGFLSLESEEGKGTKITVLLPLKQPDRSK